MATALVDSRVHSIVQWIDSLGDLLRAVRFYPPYLLRKGVPIALGKKGEDTFPGVRTFAWAVEALARLSIRPYERAFVSGEHYSVEGIIEGASREFSWAKRRLDSVGRDNDIFWLLSGYRLFALLKRFGKTAKVDVGSCDAEIAEYRRGISTAEKGDPLHDSLCFYRSFWAVEADQLSGARDGDCHVNRIPQWKELSRYSERVMRDEIAAFHCGPSMMNHMSLAAATALRWQSAHNQIGGRYGTPSDSDTSMGREIAHACNILMATPREYASNRLVQRPLDLGFLYNLPWEELYLVCGQTPASFWPEAPSVMPVILDWMAARVIHLSDWDGNRVCGFVEDSTPEYPAVAPAFTCYAICLLDVLRRGLQCKLEQLLAENLAKLSPRANRLQSEPEFSLDSDRFVDTQEGVKQTLLRLYAPDPVEGVQLLRSKNRIILFGPPGTGKTSAAVALAQYLEKHNADHWVTGRKPWAFLRINPNALLVSDSYSELVVNVRQTLDALKRVWKCVVFFDESEELVRSRHKDPERISRLFTSAMLPFLSDLDEQGNVYVFATNYICDMDEAAIRVGRFAVKKGMSIVNLSEAEKKVDAAIWPHIKEYAARCTPAVFVGLVKECAKTERSPSEWGRIFENHPHLLLKSQLRQHIKDVKEHDEDKSALDVLERLLSNE